MKAARVESMASAGLGLICLAATLCFVLLMLQRAAMTNTHAAFDQGALDPTQGLVLGAPSAPSVDPVVLQREQRALAEFIARRWRIAESAAANFVSIAYRAGRQHSVDPVLILAVMAVESRYNPVAESVMGARGLMQVIPKYHLEKLPEDGPAEALLDPELNIHVGAQILREYYRRLGDQELALQMYAGAFDEPTLQYSTKVFAERARLEPIRQRARRQTGQSV